MPNRLSRRRLLAGTGLVLAGFGLPCSARAQDAAPNVAQKGDRLRPAEEIAPDGFRVLRARPGGYHGRLPGPVLRARRFDELKVRLINETTEPTAIHWHGVRLANAMDGTPPLTQAAVAPGASFDYRFKLPDAGTFWYHAPNNAQDGAASERLFGALVVEEAQPVAVDRDAVIVLGGDRPPSDIHVRQNERVRLRLINPSNAVFTVRMERHAPRVLAIDGQPSEPFLARAAAIRLGPGNRIDMFVDAVLGAGSKSPVEAVDADGKVTTVAQLIYSDGAPARPEVLPEAPALPANGSPERMNFRGALRLDVTLPLTAPADNAPLFRAARDRVVMLALRNGATVAQSVHLHGHAFRLLDRLDDGWKPFWLDTLLVAPGEIERIAFVADNPGSWRLACAALGGAERTETWFAVA